MLFFNMHVSQLKLFNHHYIWNLGGFAMGDTSRVMKILPAWHQMPQIPKPK